MAEDASDWRPADPVRTRAIVVGVEAYEAGESWDLDGPARDAVRVVDWLRASGVPSDGIKVLLAPLERNRGLLADLPGAPGGADRASVQDAFLRWLPSRSGDLLWIYWAGHGLVDSARRRRLFYADAVERDRRNVDVDALLATMASDYLDSFARQVWVIDACQTFAAPAVLPTDALPEGKQRRDLEQDVLFAAGPGQSATNLTRESAGLFTREWLSEMGRRGDPWPPSPDEVAGALRRRFAELRAAGRMGQTPTYFWHRSRSGYEGQVMHMPPGEAQAPPKPPPSAGAIAEVVDALMEVEEFVDPRGRQEILTMMRREIATAVPRHNRDRFDAFAIVRTCCRFPGGLAELVETVRFLTGNTNALTTLEAAAAPLSS